MSAINSIFCQKFIRSTCSFCFCQGTHKTSSHLINELRWTLGRLNMSDKIIKQNLWSLRMSLKIQKQSHLIHQALWRSCLRKMRRKFILKSQHTSKSQFKNLFFIHNVESRINITNIMTKMITQRNHSSVNWIIRILFDTLFNQKNPPRSKRDSPQGKRESRIYEQASHFYASFIFSSLTTTPSSAII